ncbi:MAG: hypothetical protein DHS20C13_04110 [Thermodesulfobacteriota bacterium]|nr:MAG: hypothetical protein DHS20C13_04110 [Thermodesulfobacteriota bacterium]
MNIPKVFYLAAFALFGLVFMTLPSYSQVTETYCSTDVPLPVPPTGTGGFGTAPTLSDLVVPASAIEGGEVTKVVVKMYITHTFDSDLEISLDSPIATNVEISTDNGGAGDDYGSTCGTDDMDPDSVFDDDAGTAVTDGAAPFVGSFSPEGLLRDFNGEDQEGTWTLIVGDDATGDSGTLNCWCLDITTSEPLETEGIFPAVSNNYNSMTASGASPGGNVAFLWSFMYGSTTIAGPVCPGLEVGLSPVNILAIETADVDGMAEAIFFVPHWAIVLYTQIVDIDTCRAGEVIENVHSNN